MDESIIETFAVIKAFRQEGGQERREVATEEFPDLARLAEEKGLALTRFTETHYRLRGFGSDSWEVYPGNCRIFKSQAAPFLRLPKPWTIRDVIEAAADVYKQ